MYKSEREFEKALVEILEKANKKGKAFFRGYLGKGVFRLYMLEGDIRKSYTEWELDCKLVDGDLKKIASRVLSACQTESWMEGYKSKKDYFQGDVNRWVVGNQKELLNYRVS